MKFEQDFAHAGDASGSLEQKLAQVNDRLAALHDAVGIALADLQRARQRSEADLAHAHKFGVEEFARTLLPFKDALETALALKSSDVDAMRTGLALSLKQLHAALEKNGLQEIAPCPGELFDAHRHQALVKLGEDDGMRTVACTERKGYEIHGRILRPALVSLQ